MFLEKLHVFQRRKKKSNQSSWKQIQIYLIPEGFQVYPLCLHPTLIEFKSHLAQIDSVHVLSSGIFFFIPWLYSMVWFSARNRARHACNVGVTFQSNISCRTYILQKVWFCSQDFILRPNAPNVITFYSFLVIFTPVLLCFVQIGRQTARMKRRVLNPST